MNEALHLLEDPRNYVLHIAIALIAITLIWSLVHEMKKPIEDPNKDKNTKRMNDMLKED